MGQDGCSERCEVANAVRVCLRKSPYSEIRNLSYDFDHGVLVLRGRLSSYYEKQLAQVVIARLPGISQLVNEIEVATAPQPQDCLPSPISRAERSRVGRRPPQSLAADRRCSPNELAAKRKSTRTTKKKTLLTIRHRLETRCV
jgi:hypothetical protein